MPQTRPDHGHTATTWGELLLGRPVEDRRGRHLGTVEAVATARDGRLRRVGLRADTRGRSLRFYAAEGAEFRHDHLVLPVEVPTASRFRLLFDRRLRRLLRTR